MAELDKVKRDKGIIISASAHVALLLVALVGFSTAPKFEDAQESVPVDMVSDAQFSQVMKGEKTAKDQKPAEKAIKKAEITEKKPDAPVNPVIKEVPPVPVPPPSLKRDPLVEDKLEPSPPPQPPQKVAVLPQLPPVPPVPPIRTPEPVKAPAPISPPPKVEPKLPEPVKPEAEIVAPEPPKRPPPPRPVAEAPAPVVPPKPEPAKPEPTRPEPAKPEPPKLAQPKPVPPRPPVVPVAEKPRTPPAPAVKPVLDQVASLLKTPPVEDPAKSEADAPAKPRHARPVPPAPSRPYDPSAINSILQANASVTKPSTARDPSPTASLGLPSARAAKMSVTMGAEFDQLLKDHYNACWEKGAIQGISSYKANINVRFRQNGSLAGEPELTNRPADAQGRAIADSAMRAIRTCGPVPIPARLLAHFDEWKETTLIMNPNDL